MTDIESKLSAIKAINEEKEYCERQISLLSTLYPALLTLTEFTSPVDRTVSCAVPVKIGRQYAVTLIDYYEKRLNELIAQAYEIMKSEDTPPETSTR